MEIAVANVERFVIDEESDHLGVGDVHDDLILLGVAVPGFGVGQRSKLVYAVEVRAL